MAFWNKFPYTDFHELNLDWIIKKIKEFGDTITNFIQSVNTEIERFEDEVNNDIEDIDNKVDNFIGMTPGMVQEDVFEWLDDHPEATTTVEDNSITLAKFNSSLKGVPTPYTMPFINSEGTGIGWQSEYITPEMFGAIGDGETDDTNALKTSIIYSIKNNKKLYLISNYYITETLLTPEFLTENSISIEEPVILNISGVQPLQIRSYFANKSGSVKFSNGLTLFSNLTLSGSISNVLFAPISRTQTGYIFDNCTLTAFTFENCFVSNILAFLNNCNVRGTSKIKSNRFLTVYYFAKSDINTSHSISDSVIEGNYINGGEELNNNHCFEFTYYNGTTIINNFIDYYQTIYYVNNNDTCMGPTSIGNQYEVFRYLYYSEKRFSFSSTSDTFNHTLPENGNKCDSYEKIYYTGHDTNTYEVPPFILMVNDVFSIAIKNATIQSNVGNMIFIRKGVTAYDYGNAEFTYQSFSLKNYANSVVEADSLWNNGGNKTNKVKIPFIQVMESLPNATFNWSHLYTGKLIEVDGTIYKFIAKYDSTSSAYTPTFVDVTDIV